MYSTTQSPTRRTVAQGLAWTAPVLVAGAAPMAAASTNPTCPGCLSVQQAQGLGDAFNIVGTVGFSALSPVSTMSFTFGLDAGTCPIGIFQPTYTVLGVGATVTWSDGATNNWAAVTTGVGTFSTLSSFTVSGTLPTSTSIPNGAGFLGVYTNSQKRPTKVCFRFTAIFVPLIPIPNIECTYEVCADITSPTAVGSVVGLSGLGTGAVTWTDFTPGNYTITPL